MYKIIFVLFLLPRKDTFLFFKATLILLVTISSIKINNSRCILKILCVNCTPGSENTGSAYFGAHYIISNNCKTATFFYQ